MTRRWNCGKEMMILFRGVKQHCLMEAYGVVWDLSWDTRDASGLALVAFDVSGKVFLYLGFITGVGVF